MHMLTIIFIGAPISNEKWAISSDFNGTNAEVNYNYIEYNNSQGWFDHGIYARDSEVRGDTIIWMLGSTSFGRGIYGERLQVVDNYINALGGDWNGYLVQVNQNNN